MTSSLNLNAGLTLNAGQCSDKGTKERNEDACGILIPDEPLLTTKGVSAVIADGVSSCSAAREASESCVKGFLNDYYSSPESWTVKTAGQRILGALNSWLYSQSQRATNEHESMLTTLSAVVIKSTTAHLFHIGDTRIYLLRDGELECLTQDHQVWASDDKVFLSRAMGASPNLDIDYRKVPVCAGDVFILTCDGVHEYISNSEMKTVLADEGSSERRAKAMITLALENGSHDNVTCQVLEVATLPNQDENEYIRHLTELPFPPPLDDGVVIDGYKVLRELHASRRTQIYLALDVENDRRVILKTPSVNYDDDPEYIDSFIQEEWVGRRISSPHVMKVLDAVQQRHFLYYVTEYVEGQTLRQWMTDHPEPDIEEVRAIIKQIASGIRAFHRLEMIHQDIKPDNIMLDQHGTVKLIDFGSTRIAGIQEISKPIGQLAQLGTLDYAAPEYFRGDPGNNRSDIYSLGVIAYQMLSGALPYGGPLSKRMLKRVQYDSVCRHNPSVTDWVNGALRKAVHLDVNQRYGLLSEFVYDLSHPNKNFIERHAMPLLERNPLAFWKGLSLILLLCIMMLIYLLAAP